MTYEVSGKTRQRIEGVPIKLNRRVPRTFANSKSYDKLLVRTALNTFKLITP